MSVYLGAMWNCERCGSIVKQEPWSCPGCGNETCDNCFNAYLVCNECAKGKTDEEIKAMSETAGYLCLILVKFSIKRWLTFDAIYDKIHS